MATIGEQLKDARLQKHMTIEELQQMTKIQKKYLEALEEDNFSAMPSSYYIRAFIRQYARAVDIDGDQLVKIYDGEPLRPKKFESETVRGTRKALYSEESGMDKLHSRLPLIILSLVALGIIGVVIYATFKNQDDQPVIDPKKEVQIERHDSTTEESTKESSTESTVSSSSSEPQSSTKPPEKKMQVTLASQAGSEVNMNVVDAKNPIKLTFEGVNAACWLGVLVNGEYVYQQTLQPGTTDEYTLPEGTENATLVLGAAPNVSIKINDEPLNINPNGDQIVKKNIHLAIAYQAPADQASEEPEQSVNGAE